MSQREPQARAGIAWCSRPRSWTASLDGTLLLASGTLQAFVPGIYARSEPLVQATRDLDRGRTTLDAVDAQVERDLAELVAIQQAAGLDLLADGMLRWHDLFRPLVEASEGLELAALTRFLDTNTFYRAPAAAGSPQLRHPLDERYVAPMPGPRLVTLPSPYAFARDTGASARELAEGVLAPQLKALDAELVVLTEPFLAREEHPGLDSLADALDALQDRAPLALQLVFGDAGPLLPRLAELPVDAIGVDFYATSLDAVPEGFPKRVLAGVLDVRSSLLEDPREIADFAARLEQRAERVALVPNGDLQHVSEAYAREKVARLGAAKTAAVEAAA
jgi:5-methyltetrahydropteroyltriglutamate--homocysteine methyltransferase